MGKLLPKDGLLACTMLQAARSKAVRDAFGETAVCVVTDGTLADAKWLALGANKSHGLRRTNADKRRAVESALRMRHDWADGKIAEHVGVDVKTVGSHRERLVSTLEIPESDTRTGRDGRTIDVSRIGKPSEPQPDTPPDLPFTPTPVPSASPSPAAPPQPEPPLPTTLPPLLIDRDWGDDEDRDDDGEDRDEPHDEDDAGDDDQQDAGRHNDSQHNALWKARDDAGVIGQPDAGDTPDDTLFAPRQPVQDSPDGHLGCATPAHGLPAICGPGERTGEVKGLGEGEG